MKTRSTNPKHKWLAILVVAVIFITIFAAFPNKSVQAANGYEEGNPPTTGIKRVATAFLEKAFQREQRANHQLVSFLDKAESALSKLDEAIANGETNGKDVTPLEDARDALRESISSTQTKQMEAAEILDEHTGFDASGNVTDPKLALETIRNVKQIHNDARQMIGESIRAVFKTIREFQAENPMP